MWWVGGRGTGGWRTGDRWPGIGRDAGTRCRRSLPRRMRLPLRLVRLSWSGRWLMRYGECGAPAAPRLRVGLRVDWYCWWVGAGAYRLRAGADGYRFPAGVDWYCWWVGADAYHLQAEADAWRFRTRAGSYRSQAVPGPYRLRAGADAYRSRAEAGSYRSPAVPGPYRLRAGADAYRCQAADACRVVPSRADPPRWAAARRHLLYGDRPAPQGPSQQRRLMIRAPNPVAAPGS